MMIISGKKYLLDSNILIYSQDTKSPKHNGAIEIIDDLEEKSAEIFLTVQNLLEYSAVFSRLYKIPKKKIADDLKLFTEHGIFTILYPNESVTDVFVTLLKSEPKLYVYDLYLVAYMKAFGIETIISDDTDFEEIKDIEVLNPF